MPRFNSRGDWCAGLGGDGVYLVVNGQKVDNGPGGAGDWLNDNEITSMRWTTYEDFRAVAISQTGTQRVLRPGVNEKIWSGGGRWGTWGAAGNILDDGTVVPPIVAFGKDGSLATWVDGSHGLVIAGVKVSDAVVYTSHVIDAHTAVWMEPDGPHTIGMPVPRLLPGPVYWLRVAFDGSKWWALYQSGGIDQLVLHPFDSFVGYTLNGKFDAHDSSTWTYRPDLLILGGAKHVIWATIESELLGQLAGPYVAEEHFQLVKLDNPNPVEPNPMEAPKINVVSWDPELKSGKPWKTVFGCLGTTFTVTKDESDRLVIAAVNPVNKDVTGEVRQLVLAHTDPQPPPPPPPPPPPVKAGKVWLQPNIGSDLQSLLNDQTKLAGVGVFVFYSQHLTQDSPNPQWKDNTYPNLAKIHAFQTLKTLGIPTAMEGGPNDGDLVAIERVSDAGGQLNYLSVSEPITNHISAEVVASFAKRAKDRGAEKVGLLEAWPEVPIATQGAFIGQLKNLGAQPDYWRLDIDWVRAQREGKDTVAMLGEAQRIADSYGVPLGVFINSTVDPIATDAEHDANLRALATKIHSIVPNIGHVCVASWAERVRADISTQTVPSNLGEHGLLETYKFVVNTFSDAPPVPQNPSIMKSTVSEQPIVVKEVKPVTGTKLFTLILPDGKVLSILPDGEEDTRDAGAEGQYEKARVSGNMATYKPKDAYYTKLFVEADEL
jgi:hypothetical protein